MRFICALSFLILFLAVAFTVSGCDTSEDTGPLFHSPDGLTPRAGAIEFRDGNNYPLGMIGSGSYQCGVLIVDEDAMAEEDPGEGYPLLFDVPAAYPNPTSHGTGLMFELPRPTRVAIFVVPALGPLDTILGHTGVNVHGASIFRPGGTAIEVLQDEPLTAGRHILWWLAIESSVGGAPLPYGYYRVYVQTEYALGCWDVLYTATSPFML